MDWLRFIFFSFLLWAYTEAVAYFGDSTKWQRTLRRARWGI